MLWFASSAHGRGAAREAQRTAMWDLIVPLVLWATPPGETEPQIVARRDWVITGFSHTQCHARRAELALRWYESNGHADARARAMAARPHGAPEGWRYEYPSAIGYCMRRQ